MSKVELSDAALGTHYLYLQIVFGMGHFHVEVLRLFIVGSLRLRPTQPDLIGIITYAVGRISAAGYRAAPRYAGIQLITYKSVRLSAAQTPNLRLLKYFNSSAKYISISLFSLQLNQHCHHAYRGDFISHG